MLESYNGSSSMNQVIPNGLPLPPAIDTTNAGLLAAYYVYFHPAHPFLLPQPQMLELLSAGQFSHLELAIQYIGSLYIPPSRRGAQEEQLQTVLAQAELPKDGIMVQAMLLYSIGLHMSDHEEQSSHAMQSAIDLALELGMDKRDFAVRHGANSAILEESWRRTWWEIFVIDGMSAGVNPQYTLRLCGHRSSIDLPCEECDYSSGVRCFDPSIQYRST
jgi:Fungal specific transcription factor domain